MKHKKKLIVISALIIAILVSAFAWQSTSRNTSEKADAKAEEISSEESVATEESKPENLEDTEDVDAEESKESEAPEDAAPASSEAKVKLSGLKAEDVAPFVTGIGDIHILQDAENPDYLMGIIYDEAIVQSVGVRKGKVDLTTPGEYALTYLVTLKAAAYEEYMMKQMGIPAESTLPSWRTITIRIPAKATVVAEDEAQQLADEGTVVAASAGESVKTSTDEDVKAEAKAPESMKDTGSSGIQATTSVKDNRTAQQDAKADESEKDEETPTEAVDANAEESKKDDSSKDVTKSTSKTENTKSSTGKSSTGKASTGSNETKSGSNEPKPTSGSNSGTGNSGKTEHAHNWVAVTETIHHDEVGHYETVVVKEAWDETVTETTYEWQFVGYKCKCGNIFNKAEEWKDHSFYFAIYGTDEEDELHSSCASVEEQVPVTTTNIIHHDAETEQRWVVDQAAYDETVTTGYVCSECGAKK